MRVGTVNIFSFVLENDIDDLYIIEGLLKKHNITNYKLFQKTKDLLENLTADIHIILIDHYLEGGLLGTDVCKEIKKISKDSFVIIVTGQTSMDIVIEYLNSCANKYINKNRPGYLEKLKEFLDDGLAHAVARVNEINTLTTMRQEIKERRKHF